MSIREFLKNLDLEAYAEAFEANEVTVEILHTLSDADLKELGVEKLGPRRVILEAIEKKDSPPELPSPPEPMTSDASCSPDPHLVIRLARLLGRASQAGVDLGPVPGVPTPEWLDEREALLGAHRESPSPEPAHEPSAAIASHSLSASSDDLDSDVLPPSMRVMELHSFPNVLKEVLLFFLWAGLGGVIGAQMAEDNEEVLIPGFVAQFILVLASLAMARTAMEPFRNATHWVRRVAGGRTHSVLFWACWPSCFFGGLLGYVEGMGSSELTEGVTVGAGIGLVLSLANLVGYSWLWRPLQNPEVAGRELWRPLGVLGLVGAVLWASQASTMAPLITMGSIDPDMTFLLQAIVYGAVLVLALQALAWMQLGSRLSPDEWGWVRQILPFLKLIQTSLALTGLVLLLGAFLALMAMGSGDPSELEAYAPLMVGPWSLPFIFLAIAAAQGIDTTPCDEEPESFGLDAELDPDQDNETPESDLKWYQGDVTTPGLAALVIMMACFVGVIVGAIWVWLS